VSDAAISGPSRGSTLGIAVPALWASTAASSVNTSNVTIASGSSSRVPKR
jgi:hypothetical protein